MNNMDDIESGVTSTPVRACRIPCRLRGEKLNVAALVRFACFVTTTECIVALLILNFAVSNATSELVLQQQPIGSIHLRILPALSLVPISIQYTISWLNISAGGWGAPDSRFWCDIKIMYVRGFNTIRTIARMCCTAILFGAFTISILEITDLLILAFLCPLAALAEWQAGLVELQNQYDVKLDDKFIEDNALCLETLQYHQENRARTVKTWVPYVLSVATKMYMTTWVVYCASIGGTDWSVYGLLTIAIVLYLDIVPFVLLYLYERNQMTFCELELYRVISDCILPCIICFIVYLM